MTDGGEASTSAQAAVETSRQTLLPPTRKSRALRALARVNKWLIKPVLVCAFLFVSFVYINGLVTRMTNVYALPFKDGESFCIVGNGPGVGKGEMGYGDFIDSHDHVVRFNTVVLEPPDHTGSKTDVHVITAGSPKQHITGALSIIVYSSWIHDKLAEWAHPYTFPLHSWGAKFKEDTGVVGPSSGLLVTKFLSEVYPNSRVSTIGMGEFSQNNMSEDSLHYFSPDNGTWVDRVYWKIESTYSLHHNNETKMFETLRKTHRNVETVQKQVAAGATSATAPTAAAAPSAAAPLANATGNSSRGDRNSSLRRALRSEGFQLVSGIFSRGDVQTMRDEMLTRRADIERHPIKRFFHRIVNPTGMETVDFMHSNRAYYAATSWLSSTPTMLESKLKPYLAQHFGDDAEVDWFFHNDIGINHLSRWHKDRLNNNLLGRYRDDYEELDPWEEGPYDIYKCLIYLQDHGGPHGVGPALDVIPGTHLMPPSAEGGEGSTWNDLAPQNDSVIHPVAPLMGDVIIFDQRITHRGHSNVSEVDKVLRSLAPSAPDGSDARILVTVGFGLKSSKHLPGFREGTLARQHAVFFVTEKMFVLLDTLLPILGLLLLYWLSTRRWNVLCSRRSFMYLCGKRWSSVSSTEVYTKPLASVLPSPKKPELVVDVDATDGPPPRRGILKNMHAQHI